MQLDHHAPILAAAAGAAQAVPPLWPLAASVAVNPFLGQSGDDLATAAARLGRAAGIPLTMPRDWYAERHRAGEITDADLQAALDAAPAGGPAASLAELKAAMRTARPEIRPLPTIADLAAAASGIDWPGLIAERIGHWAASYFDDGQALWAAGTETGAYAAWRMAAAQDLTPEIAGLAGFARLVGHAPPRAEEALAEAVAELAVEEAGLEAYFHRLMATLGGWAQLARWRDWQAGLAGGADRTPLDLLAIRLTWECALLRQFAPRIAEDWRIALAAYARPVVPSPDDLVDAILQDAAERAALRRLAPVATGSDGRADAARPRLQVAFCIDVRSEVFRRGLESLDPAIRTHGTAGFFGLGVGHRRFASDLVEPRLPVLLAPPLASQAGGRGDETADRTARIVARAKRAWGRFKVAAISSFAFVEASGPLHAVALLRDGLGLAARKRVVEPAPRLDPACGIGARVGLAAGALRSMALTDGFARLVVVAGHGAAMVNNAHAGGLQCGACGGYSGDVNARLLAGLLNDRQVRQGLAALGIAIPEDTLFLAALHDTVTDVVTVFAGDHDVAAHQDDLRQAQAWLDAAGVLARGERQARLPGTRRGAEAARRARDWAEVRPEWGLAGCQLFIAAPRRRTAGRNLAGRAFLHDYDWRQDEGFAGLEGLMAGPVVVASWISLQYYGSAVAPAMFGAGNKLIHNVTGGVGVVEGNAGVLRGGLPRQSVHDGERLVHQPLRLTVLVEAPREALAGIVLRNTMLRDLFDNGWMHLVAIDDEGRMARRRGSEWEAIDGSTTPPVLEAA